MLCVLGCIELTAQTGLHIGFFGGVQYTKILNSESIDPAGKGFATRTTWGQTGMFKLGYNFVPPIGLHVAAIYSTQGQDYTTVDDLGTESRTSRRATYIKVPILIHMSSNPGPAMFTMEIGPQFGILRDASVTVNGLNVPLSVPTTLLWKPNDFAVAWSLGAEFAVTKGFHLVIQHRGDYGIFDFENKRVINNGSLFFQADRKKANNLTLGIVAGVNFVVTGAHSKTTRHFKGKTWRGNWR